MKIFGTCFFTEKVERSKKLFFYNKDFSPRSTMTRIYCYFRMVYSMAILPTDLFVSGRDWWLSGPLPPC